MQTTPSGPLVHTQKDVSVIVVDKDLPLFAGLHIHPVPDPQCIQPASIDLRLGNVFKMMDTSDRRAIDPETGDSEYWTYHVADGDWFQLVPGGFVLATTAEEVHMPGDLAGQVIDKSSLARLGLGLHAGFIDPGFRGHITLEIVNHAPRGILLKPGMSIGQLVLFMLSSVPQRIYGDKGLNSHYQNQPAEPIPSRSHETHSS